ncbi:MAG: hypothetical protein JJ895_15880 [Balneolaceae bacterium]|nr:hypothetical protein [Balneolaceae bacterium]
MIRFMKRDQGMPSYLKRLASYVEPDVPEMKVDGLTIETAFREHALPPDVSNDYNRYLTPLHGEEDSDWTVKNEEFVPTGERHRFYNLVTIELSNGETRQYYFNKSANFCVLYADEMEQIRNARENRSGWLSRLRAAWSSSST